MKLKIFSAFTIGLFFGLGIGAGVTAWTQRREQNPAITVERLEKTKSGATFRIQTHE